MPEVEGSPIGELVAQSYVTSTTLYYPKMSFASPISEVSDNICPEDTNNNLSQCNMELELKQ